MIRLSRHVAVSLLLAILALVSGCQSYVKDDQSGADSEPVVEMEMCVDPRSEICTMEFAPVCGVRDGGEKESFPNGCGACSNQEIVGYLPGECAE
jgi:hypothetical protein